MTNVDKSELKALGIEVREHWLGEPRDGAHTGEFQTIFLVILSGIAGGFLSAVGKDIWSKLKDYIAHRYRDLEIDRKQKAPTREQRHRIWAAYIVCHAEQVPIIYYVLPSEGELNIAFDETLLSRAEADIRTLIRAGKVRKGHLLGIHLTRLGTKPYLRVLKGIPSGEIVLEDMTMNLERVEAWTHAEVAEWFEMIERPDDAQRHYEIAIQGEPKHAGLRRNLGIVFSRKGNLTEALRHWEAAAEIDKQLDVLHYNIACFHALHGDVQSVAAHLQLAIDNGFRDVGMLLRDAEFARVINSPEIDNIIKKIRGLLTA